MSSRSGAAALLPVWALIGLAGLASTLSFTAVAASRTGCIETQIGELVSVGGIAGIGLAVSALLLVGTVPRYRALPQAFGAVCVLALSVYAVVTYLAQDGTACGS